MIADVALSPQPSGVGVASSPLISSPFVATVAPGATAVLSTATLLNSGTLSYPNLFPDVRGWNAIRLVPLVPGTTMDKKGRHLHGWTVTDINGPISLTAENYSEGAGSSAPTDVLVRADIYMDKQLVSSQLNDYALTNTTGTVTASVTEQFDWSGNYTFENESDIYVQFTAYNTNSYQLSVGIQLGVNPNNGNAAPFKATYAQAN